MRKRLDRTLLGTIATSLVGQAVLMVSGVIVARLLGPTDRGHLAAFVLIGNIAAFAIAIGVPVAVTLELAAMRRTVGELIIDLRLVVVTQALVSILAPLAVLIAFYRHSGVLTAALWTVPVAVSQVAFRYGAGILQGKMEFLRFNVCRIVPASLYAIGAAIGWLVGARSLATYAAIFSITSLVGSALIVFVALSGDRTARTGRRPIRSMIRYGLKAQIGTASILEDLRFDQVAVAVFLTPAGLGLYVVASAFMNLPRFIGQSLGLVLFPRVAARLESGGKRRLIGESVALAALICGVTVVALIVVVGALIPFFFGDQYIESIAVARILLIAAFFSSMRRVVGDALRGAEIPLPGTAAEIVSVTTFVALVAFFAPAHGISGVAFAFAGSSALSVAFLACATLVIGGKRRGAS